MRVRKTIRVLANKTTGPSSEESFADILFH